MHVSGSVLPFAPGDVVDVEGQQHLIHAVSITGHPQETTASQTFHLQPGSLLLPTHRTPPSWPARAVWAYVTDNDHDPDQQGRIQVEFEFEPLDPQPSGERVWLHTLTPYGGGQGPGAERLLPGGHSPRAHAYSGFLSLPEVGERVLVQFHAAWDNDAVVLGSIRQVSISPADSARDTKRWRTPSGNEIALTTEGEGAAAKDVVSVHARDHVVLQGVVDPSGESVSVQCGDSYIHLLNKGGSVRVEVVSGGAMLLHAAGHLQIEGDSIQIKAKGGQVRVSDVVTSSTGKLRTPRKTFNKTVTKGKGRSYSRAAHNKNHHGMYQTMHGSVAGSPTRRGVNREAYARAIAQKESSGNYQSVGIFVPRKHESGYALGAYQFMSYPATWSRSCGRSRAARTSSPDALRELSHSRMRLRASSRPMSRNSFSARTAKT